MAASVTTQPSGFRFMRLHPALVAGNVLSALGPKGELIQPICWSQSPLDSACGACTVASALSILSLIRPASLLAMSRRKSGPGMVFFEQMKEFWHTGINGDELIERVAAMGLELKLTARFKTDTDLDKFVIDTAMKGELVALTIASLHTRRTSHWVLCTGSGGIQHGNKTEVDRLYLLDASSTAPVFREWNSVLSLLPSSRKKRLNGKPPDETKRKPFDWSYSASEWRPETVRITSAIRFRRT